MIKRLTLTVVLFSFLIPLLAQDDVRYKMPPKEMADMLTVKPTPGVSINDEGTWILFTETSSYAPVEELAKPEVRVAGLRINPNNFSPSRQNFVNNLYLKNIAFSKVFPISGLPTPLYAGGISWSSDNKKIAFTHTSQTRVDLYVVDVATQKATRINKTPLNTVTGTYSWYDNNSVMYRGIVKPPAAAPQRPLTPQGPAVQENYGKASPRPTFQDMLKSPYDEMLFAFLTTTQLVKNTNGVESKIGQPSIYTSITVSPDKKFLMLRTAKKPYSYLVPYSGFPSELIITDITGKPVKKLADLPSTETAPGGNDNVQPGPRAFEWRDDEPATVVWCERLIVAF